MKKRLFGLTVLIVGIMLAFTLAGCGDDSSGDQSTPPGGGTTPGYTSGWPSPAIVTEFGLTGLVKPAGVTEEEYSISTGRVALLINFKGTGDIASIHDCFIANGWTLDETSWFEPSGDFMRWYEKTNGDEGSYDWRSITGSSTITVILDQP